MGNGVEGDDKFNVPPERIREIVGEDKDHEGIVAGARMLMSQRADKALASREAPKVPALVVGTEEEFFLALARRRSDRTHVNTTMPRRIEFADGFKPHLKERDLSNLDLRNIDFGNAYLEGMVLRGCDLSGSSFYEANMKNVDLTWAVCRDTNFAQASLIDVKLTGADCTDADFYEAELVDTDLRNANFSGAYMQGIVFVVVDARKANIFGAVFNPTLNITSTDGAEIITSAAEIARRLGFVDVPPSK